jgi:hypothetical protein
MLTAQRSPTRTKIEDQTRSVLDSIASARLVELKKSVGGAERCLFGSSPYASNTLAQNRRFSCHFGSVTSAARHSFFRHAGCERPAPLTSKTNKLDIIVDRTKQGDKLVKRVCEEELMDVPLQAESYAGADFSEPNSKFVAHFADKFPAFQGHHILDLGCGPGDIMVRLAARYPQARVIGLDGADAMLDIARKVILQHTALANRVDVRRWI